MGASYSRAAQLFDARRHDLAERLLRRDLELEPDDPWSHALLGLCLHRRKKSREAIAHATEAIRLAPTMAFAHYALGAAHCGRGRPGRRPAKAALEEAVRLDPQVAEYHFLLAAVEYDLGRPRAALELANRGLAIDPGHVRCANIRALALKQCGRAREAIPTIDWALARDPESDYTHTNRGWLLLGQRDYFRADEHFREALRLNPMNEQARRGRKVTAQALWPCLVLVRAGLALGLLRANRPRADGRDGPLVAPNWVAAAILAVVVLVMLGFSTGNVFAGAFAAVAFGATLPLAALCRHARRWLRVPAFAVLAVALLFWYPAALLLGLFVHEVPFDRLSTGRAALVVAARVVHVVSMAGIALYLFNAAIPRADADDAARRAIERRDERRRRRRSVAED